MAGKARHDLRFRTGRFDRQDLGIDAVRVEEAGAGRRGAVKIVFDLRASDARNKKETN